MSSDDVELCFSSALDLAARIRAKDWSCTEVIQAFLHRIEEVNPVVNAVISLREDAALEEARKLDSSPGPPGLLQGVPFTVKDLTETADLPTTYGSLPLRDERPTFDAIVVERLRQAGAILVGKTNTPEFGLRPTTDNQLFGATRNPWNTAYDPAGSSGGAAAAAAAGLSPIAHGTDGGGSCRLPAAACGVVGVKATRGRVPLAPAAYESPAGLSASGPVARTVRDAAVMLDIMAGPVVGEPYGCPAPSETFLAACDRVPRRLRLAYTTRPPYGQIDPVVKSVFVKSLEAFAHLGHELVEAGPELAGLQELQHRVLQANIAADLPRRIAEGDFGRLEPTTLSVARHGWAMPATAYCAAVAKMRHSAARVMRFWEDFDFLLTPTLPRLPSLSGALRRVADYATRWARYFEMCGFTAPFNVTGQPAISLPAGWDADTGLPIGLQIVARPAKEELMFALAANFESHAPWAHHRPGL